MESNHDNSLQRDTASIIMACLFIFIGALSIWDTTSMLDADSYVFPRAVAIAMIVLSIALIVWHLVKPRRRPEAVVQASTVRRVLLVATMIGGCLTMPFIGFLIPGIATFGLLMMIAMYDQWTLKRKLLYPVIAVAIVVGFYTLFGNVLQVPLPVGSLFE